MKTFFKKINRKKFITISICLFLSIFTWISAKLSATYNERIPLKVNYTNIPSDVVLSSNSLQKIEADIVGSGYSILKYNFFKKDINLDINNLAYLGNNNYILPKSSLNLIDKTLFPDVSLKNIYPDTIKIKMLPLISKKIPVRVQLTVNPRVEYKVKAIKHFPDSVTLYGSSSLLDTISEIKFSKKIDNAKQSFEHKFHLKNTKNLRYSVSSITSKVEIIRISQKKIQKSIQIIGAPTASNVKIFPKNTQVILSGDVNILRNFQEGDLLISADFKKRKKDVIPIEIIKKPEGLKVTILQKNVEFLIEEKCL